MYSKKGITDCCLYFKLSYCHSRNVRDFCLENFESSVVKTELLLSIVLAFPTLIKKQEVTHKTKPE